MLKQIFTAFMLMGLLYLLIVCWHGYDAYHYVNNNVLQQTQYDSNNEFHWSKTPKCLEGRATESGISCREISENSRYFVKKKIQYNPPKMTVECELEQLVKNCSLFKEVNGYNQHLRGTIAGNSSDFSIAFGIKMHILPYQAEQLLRTIYHPQNVYWIHVDRKSATEIQDLFVNISRCFDNVHVVQHNIKLRYATYDHILVEKILMESCRKSKQKWKYYINLTGQEFPLKTNSEMIQILKLLNGLNDIESHPFSDFEFQYRILRFRNTTVQPIPYGIKPYKGSAYGAFTRKFVDFILDNPKAKEVMLYFRNTKAPEETVWATLNRLPEAPGGVVKDTRHANDQHLSKAVIWQWDKPKCHGHYSRSVCVFAAGDLMWLKSRPELFANKFHSERDKVSIDCLEEEIRNRTRMPYSRLNFNYYRHLPQVLQNIQRKL